ncbi:cytochrome C biogenesis protein transmembrane region [Leptospira fainei serovar Hurstbridge str. BUT 6]|uniref:Cytochrome C biogenesis protein transmembrane region n=1 Tax=Leptospira fainei serovar Hurstbridge str. BUT 6 TaxID=1193011 RepID=S3W3J8_9LEPT|nr:cytochrome c biogenesis protein CcdA [Leptospira fainei]EPG74872.1 cytochrome C biogenesis protein transmembrane region [Leptospira fainei serovar Hurstbridge str. BUT 6]
MHRPAIIKNIGFRPINVIAVILVVLAPLQLWAEGSISPNAVQSLNRWIENGINGESFSVFSAVFLFAGGLFASLLPCVYPLYPITVGIIQSRGQSTESKILHPLLYYVGLSFMYLCFGVLAGLTGGAFNTILRFPVTNLILSILIFLLALASVNLLHIPGRYSNNTKGYQGWKGTFLLGMGAGFLSSPCVGPVVVAILIQVTAGVGSVSISSLALASVKMTLFGMGLGLPFLMIGVFGLHLPRSGKWLKWIQMSLGLLVFYFAWLYYIKAMNLWGVQNHLSISILVAGLGIFLTSYFYQNKILHKTERTKKALLLTGSVLFIALFIRLVGWGTAPDVYKEDLIEQHGNLGWHRVSQAAFEVAKSEARPVFVDFYADWCTNCKEFEELTLSDPELNKALNHAVLLKIKDDDKEFQSFEQDPRFPELKIGLPFFVIFSPDGQVLFKTNNYLNTPDMIRTIRGEFVQAKVENYKTN